MFTQKCSQIILDTMSNCKQKQLDFHLIYEYVDDKNKKHLDFIDCSHDWNLIDTTDHATLQVYDKGWDDTTEIPLYEVYDCIPIHKDFNSIINNLLTLFQKLWDNKNYEAASIIMNQLNTTIQNKTKDLITLPEQN